jgi:amino acid permease
MKQAISWYQNFFLPVAILADLVIGAGVFTLPYIFYKSGFLIGAIYLVVFGVIALVIHLMYAEVVIKTKTRHRLIGYANIYLGKFGFYVSLVLNLLGNVLVLGVFLILSVSFFNLIWQISIWQQVLIIWGISPLLIFVSNYGLAESELWLNDGILLGLLSLFLLKSTDSVTLWPSLLNYNLENWLLPLGPVAFSFLGIQAVPLVIDYFRDRAPHLVTKDYVWERRIIKFGTLLPVVLYAIFIVAILFVSSEVTPDSVSGLIGQIGAPALFIVGIFGILNIRSSYTIIGRDLRDSLVYDLNLKSKWLSFGVLLLPLIVFILFQNRLVDLVSFIGSVIVVVQIILVIWMWVVVKKKEKGRVFI